jgi:hypothetical protein
MKSPILALLGLAVSLGACMVGDPTMPKDEDLPPEGSEAALSNNPRTAFNYFVSKGLTDIQAAGIVGNLMQESSVRPTAVQPGGPGRGIAQWSVGGRFDHGSSSLTAYASSHGGSKWSLQTQLDFIWYELTVVGGYGYSDLRAATTINRAVWVFQDEYEICGACASSQRVTYANQILAQYGGSSSGGTSGGGSDDNIPPDDGSCYSGTLERQVPENTCVESKFDGYWYQCSNGSWIDRWSDPDACVSQYPL